MICIDSLRGIEMKWGGNILDGQIQFSRVPRDVGQQIHICKVFDPVLEVHMHSYVFRSKLSSFWARVRN